VSRPTTSIVLLVRNQLDCTRACVESIRRCTPEPYELVFVDNGSTDGTAEWLRTLDDAFVVTNEENLGFGAGCNQGIAASTGERILLLNNDVVVTEGWLGALHDALDSGEDVGLAGPRTDNIAGSQRVEEVGYDRDTLEGLDSWAARWCVDHAGQRTDTNRLVGFCILLERAVVERIGGFDLRYGLGNFEDDDLCLRARVAGFRCVVAHDSFMHHVGSRTFAGEGIDHGATMAENLERFAAAWRMRPEEFDGASYQAGAIVARTDFDPARHFAPPVAGTTDDAKIALDGARSTVVAVGCERFDPDGTRTMLETALRRWGPGDDVTVLVRIDPRDRTSSPLLEAVADEVGEDALPDVVVAIHEDGDDDALLACCDLLVTAGRFAWTRRLLAARAGVEVVD